MKIGEDEKLNQIKNELSREHSIVSIEHDTELEALIITYRFPSNEVLLSHPPRPVPDRLMRVVYEIESIPHIQYGSVKTTPATTEFIYK